MLEPDTADERQRGHSILNHVVTLSKKKALILKITVAFALVSIVIVLLIPNSYKGQSKIMPPEKNSSSLNNLLTSQLSPLNGLGAGGLTLKNPSDLYVVVLQSRSLADSLISRFKLLSVYDVKYAEQARDRLKDRTQIRSSNEGVISIAVEDRDPQRAADLANAYVEEMRQLLQKISNDEASQRKLYFEQQLALAQDQLADAEISLQKIQQKTGLIQPESQGWAMVQAIADTQTRIMAAELRVSRLRLYSSEQNPDLIRAEKDLSSMRTQLRNLEQKQQTVEGGVLLATKQVPAAAVEYFRGLRKVRYQEGIFAALAKQYEAARLDESRNPVTIEFLERAVKPERKVWPPRLILVLVSTMIGFLFSVLFVLAKASFDAFVSNPEHQGKLATLGKELALSRTGR
jgi:tyrosine-protein kinase Etk/Wzc